jgi:hypothetical protein
LDALETAAVLVEQHTVANLLERLASHAVHDFSAEWAAIVDLDSPLPVATVGTVPPAPWLGAFVAGSRASISPSGNLGGPDDVAWAEMETASLVLVIGRHGRPFRARERQQLAALARIANHRWVELVTRLSRMIHPSSAP